MRGGKNKLTNNQQGLVSFIVTLFIMIVLSLIVMAFARMIRREQRQSLDRQLNSQALYAAESGINDAIKALKNDPTLLDRRYTECSGPESFITKAGLKNDLGDGSTSYSCLLVDPLTKILEYSNIDTDQSRVIPIIPKPGVTLRNIYISWEDALGNTNFNCPNNSPAPGEDYPNLPVMNRWRCSPGLLRVDIVPLPPSGGIQREALDNLRFTAFLYPRPGLNDASSIDYAPNHDLGNVSKQGDIPEGNCNSNSAAPAKVPRHCKVRIRLPSTLQFWGADNVQVPRSYYLRLKSIYNKSTVSITATDDEGGTHQVELTQAQAVIDSTGKANDVLKRLQVNIPITRLNGLFPEYPLQAIGSICKRLGIAPPDHVRALDPPIDDACKPAVSNP